MNQAESDHDAVQAKVAAHKTLQQKLFDKQK